MRRSRRESRFVRAASFVAANPRGLWGLSLLAGFILLGLVGPLFTADPSALVARPHEPPSMAHWLGTTGQGQDVLAQFVTGTRTSLLTGLLVGLLVVAVGAVIGVAAGYAGGWLDDALLLVMNVLLVIPSLPLAIVLAAYLPASTLSVALVLVVTGWAFNARVLRSQALSLRERDFVAAARVAGESELRIVLVELLPNMGPLLLSQFIGATTYAIGAQVGLEFLGLGDVGHVTWGTNLYWASNDQALLTGAWWTFVPTGLGIATVAFALTLLSGAVDELSNPGLRAERPFRAFLRSAGVLRAGSTPVVRT